jgi:type VI protein secretion system component VasF
MNKPALKKNLMFVLCILLLGIAGAFRVIERRERREEKANQDRLRQEVRESIEKRKLNLPPLSEAAKPDRVVE